MAQLCALPTYQRRQPEGSVLHRTLQAHLDTFLARTAGDEGAGLPPFVTRELRAYLRCGLLEHGCVHVRCPRCADEMVVAFSCKGRGVCPSCGGRRMSALAAKLVEHVIPHVPVRQWVLSLPWSLRYQLAFDAALCREVLAVFMRVVFGWLAARAARGRRADRWRPRTRSVSLHPREPNFSPSGEGQRLAIEKGLWDLSYARPSARRLGPGYTRLRWIETKTSAGAGRASVTACAPRTG